MQKSLICLLLFLIFVAGAQAEIFIYEPQDKLTTFEEVIMLRGAGRKLEVLKVNEQRIDFKPDGSFSCGLILKPG